MRISSEDWQSKWTGESVTERSRIVAVLGDNAEKHVREAEIADMIELRLDLIEKANPLTVLKAVRDATFLPIIATARFREEGGMFQGSEEERIDLLIEASRYSDYVDVELMAGGRDEVLGRIKKPAIVSYHDFKKMPDDFQLAEIFGRMKTAKADIAKIAVTPHNMYDNLRILKFLLDADMPLCMIAMGQIGRHLRAVAPLYGSVLTYGFITESTAPGQMSLADLCQARRLLDEGLSR
ncbi:MAG TPA: type I 3-dehydroquinate dehydratase [Methanothrix sp.]|nr:type I 3-dehydroquinate dehydratase [Methanothrix sp.]